MQARSRSLAGAAMAVIALPVFIGLTACLPTFPVPVGNPEKSTIDPYISGIWMAGNADEAAFYLFEPYDKRSWLLTYFALSENVEACPSEIEAIAGADAKAAAGPDVYAANMARIAALPTRCFDVDRGQGALKAWRTRLGGEWFMTWENKGVFTAETGFDPAAWTVFRIDKSTPGELRLGWFNMEHEAWDALKELEDEAVTRSAVEKIIRRHADEQEFYANDAEVDFVFYRVRPEDYELIADFVDEGMLD